MVNTFETVASTGLDNSHDGMLGWPGTPPHALKTLPTRLQWLLHKHH